MDEVTGSIPVRSTTENEVLRCGTGGNERSEYPGTVHRKPVFQLSTTHKYRCEAVLCLIELDEIT